MTPPGPIVSRRSDVRWRQSVRGVLLHASELDEPVLVTSPGDLVWDGLDRPRSIDELVVAMAELFGGDPGTIRTDVTALVDSLESLGVIDVAR